MNFIVECYAVPIFGKALCQYLQVFPPEFVRHSREVSSKLLSREQKPGFQHFGSSIGEAGWERVMFIVTESLYL